MTEGERNRLDVIESKLDSVLIKLTYIEKTGADHEERIRSVERWKLSVPISVLLAMATIVGGFFGHRTF